MQRGWVRVVDSRTSSEPCLIYTPKAVEGVVLLIQMLWKEALTAFQIGGVNQRMSNNLRETPAISHILARQHHNNSDAAQCNVFGHIQSVPHSPLLLQSVSEKIGNGRLLVRIVATCDQCSTV